MPQIMIDQQFVLRRPGIFGLGVADGVYMWKAKGIDSGLFSRTLMSSARQNVKTGMNDVVKCKWLPSNLPTSPASRCKPHLNLSNDKSRSLCPPM